MDLNNLMQMATQLREQLTSAQQEAANAHYDGEAGGGMVKVVMNGRHELVELKIDPAVFKSDEVKLLEDLVRAAVNQASARVAESLQSKMGNLAQGLGIDPSAFMPGGDPNK